MAKRVPGNAPRPRRPPQVPRSPAEGKSPNSAVGRALRVAAIGAGISGSYIGYLAQRLFLDETHRDAKLRAAHTKAGRRMTKELGALRGPLMKVGQLLSLQTDLLPEETLAELSTLQMAAPAMHPSLVRAQFRSSLKRDPEEVFTSFGDMPFAAASLGQVHRAVTHEGQMVAVKIQYPGMADAIKSDFKWLRAIALPARLSRYVSPTVIDELEKQITAETDYVREAANMELFRDRLAPLPFVEVPRVDRACSGGRVLTTSLLPGDHLDAFLERRPSQRLRDLVGARLFELYYFQLLAMGAFHADPNWGNYLFRRDGSIGLIDFGCVKYVSDAFIANLRQIFLYAGPRQSVQFRSLLDERYSLHGQKLGANTKTALVRFAERFYGRVYPPDPAMDDRAFDFSETAYLRDYLRESANLLRAKGALPEYVLLARAEAGLYQTLHRLRARVNTSRIVRRYLDRPPTDVTG